MKYALVTGSTKGIGKAVAKELLQNGYFVFLNYSSDKKTADHTYKDFSATFGDHRLAVIQANLSSFENVEKISETVSSYTRQLDVLVLNAGATDRSKFENITVEGWGKVMNTNVNVPLFLLQRLLPLFSHGSSVLFTGSLLGERPHAMSLAYGVSKAAVHAMVKNLVKFFAGQGISVNAIAPGFVETEWQKEKPNEIKQKIKDKIAAKRFAEPDEIAKICYAIIENPYINGQVIIADGGYNYK